MKKYSKILFLSVVVVIILIYLFFNFLEPKKVCFKDNCFFVEAAKTNTEREKGLMNRKKLDKNKGMLFIFDKEGIFPFWMKNTLIPLDIIWIDADKKVVYINENTQLCQNLICPSIIPSTKAKYVLEINAGLVKELNIKISDLVQISPGL